MTDLVIVRVFAASRERVYRAFTDTAVPARWYGPAVPAGVAADPPVNEEDPARSSSAPEPSGGEPGHVDPARTDAVLWVSRHPAGLRTRLEFHDEPDNRTRLVLREGPHESEAELASREAWSSRFMRLDRLLLKL